MIIRSQDGTGFVNFGAGCVIGTHYQHPNEIVMECNNTVYTIGKYGTHDEAMQTIDAVWAALQNGEDFYYMPVSKETIKRELRKDVTLNDLQKSGELSNRTANALRRAGYITLEEAYSAGKEKLIKVQNLGASSICELYRVYEKYQEVQND